MVLHQGIQDGGPCLLIHGKTNSWSSYHVQIVGSLSLLLVQPGGTYQFLVTLKDTPQSTTAWASWPLTETRVGGGHSIDVTLFTIIGSFGSTFGPSHSPVAPGPFQSPVALRTLPSSNHHHWQFRIFHRPSHSPVALRTLSQLLQTLSSHLWAFSISCSPRALSLSCSPSKPVCASPFLWGEHWAATLLCVSSGRCLSQASLRSSSKHQCCDSPEASISDVSWSTLYIPVSGAKSQLAKPTGSSLMAFRPLPQPQW